MLIQYTEEEILKLEEIKAAYKEKIEALMEPAASEEERKLLSSTRAQLSLQLSAELEAYSEQCQRKRFALIAADPQAILENARQQIPAIIEYEYKEFTAYAGAEDIKNLNIGCIIKDKFYLNANLAAELLKDELKLHINALQNDRESLQLLFSYIIEGAEDSEYTDSADITITASTKTPLEVLRFRRSPLADIKTYGLMNDKVNAQLIQDNGLFSQNTDGQITLTWAVNQAPQKKEQVPVYVALTYEGTEGRLTKKLTAFDSAVYNAVATRFYYWQQDNQQKPLYITPQEIWRTMNGKRSGDGKAKPSAAQVKKICASLDKMRFTRFYMDISEEIKAYELYIEDERIIGGRIDGYLLNSSKVEFTTDKGNTVAGYRIGEEPLLYTYNAAKKHILYVPYEMLDTSTNINDSENVTEFRSYLLQQIQLMKNAAEDGKKGRYFKRNSVILIESIYKDTGIQTPEERAAATAFTTENARNSYIRKTRKADRGKIEGILDAWKAKGWIKGYTVLNASNKPIKEKQQAKGYDIHI